MRLLGVLVVALALIFLQLHCLAMLVRLGTWTLVRLGVFVWRIFVLRFLRPVTGFMILFIGPMTLLVIFVLVAFVFVRLRRVSFLVRRFVVLVSLILLALHVLVVLGLCAFVLLGSSSG